MVRLQRVAYEQIVNSATLKRARSITSPKKWYTTNPHEHMQYVAHDFYRNSWLGKLLYPIYNKIFNMERAFHRDVILQQGLTFEDRFLHHDADLRRCNLFEHIARESLHPYHWVLKVRRRERYFKVERGVRAFFVPEHVRSEAASQTYNDFQRVRKEWFAFTHHNYWSDMTPTASRTAVPKFYPLEWMLNYGVMRVDAWSRFFINETDNGWASEKELATIRDPKKYPYDITTAHGKREFEAYINDVNEKYPGMVSVEGEKFDFKSYYEKVGV